MKYKFHQKLKPQQQNQNEKNKTKIIKKKKKEAKRFGLNLQKIQSKTKTHIQSERENRSERKRIGMRERERIHHRRRSIPPYHRCRSPIAMLRHNGGSLRRVLLRVRFHWENLFLLFFWLNSFFFNTTQLYTIKKI